MRIAVIIPTLNEEHRLPAAVGSIVEGAAGSPVEVVVSDGGSTDDTIAVAQRLGLKVVRCGGGRGAQMDRAVRLCEGADTLLFLHADTRLPAGWYQAVAEALSDEHVVGGGFCLAIDDEGVCPRLVEEAVRWRSRVLGLIYGDQAIFVRAKTFQQVGGFRGLPLMEDVDLVRRLKKDGTVVLLDMAAVTSARRWQRRGYLGTTLRNWSILVLYYLGVPPERLYRAYYSKP